MDIVLMRNLHLIFYLAAAWLIGASLLRAWLARGRQAGAVAFSTRIVSAAPVSLNFLAALFVSLGLWLGAGLFFQGRVLTALLALAAAILAASALDLTVALARPVAGGSPFRARTLAAPALAVLLGAGLFAFAVYLRSVPGGRAEALQLDWPVRGTWRVAAGGRSALTNYHHGNPQAQNCAVDLMRSEGESEGAAVYAPLSGLVVAAVNDRIQGSPEAEGNIVIIKSEEGAEVWLAHLRRQSVRVKKGDRVECGQQVAECGATGSAESAHLHLHAQKDGRPVPMVFGAGGRFLVRNDQFMNDAQ